MFHVDMMAVVERLSSDINIVRTVRYWDKAGTAGGTGARTAGVKMSLMKNGKIVIHDSVKGRWGSDERERIIRATAEADGKEVTQIIEQEGGSGGKESAHGTLRNLVGFHCVLDRPTGDKAFRADPFSVQVNVGQVILIRGDWIPDFKQEYALFPLGTYKDQVDAGSGAFNALIGRKEARVLR